MHHWKVIEAATKRILNISKSGQSFQSLHSKLVTGYYFDCFWKEGGWHFFSSIIAQCTITGLGIFFLFRWGMSIFFKQKSFSNILLFFPEKHSFSFIFFPSKIDKTPLTNNGLPPSSCWCLLAIQSNQYIYFHKLKKGEIN